jgi:uncharacterized protein
MSAVVTYRSLCRSLLLLRLHPAMRKRWSYTLARLGVAGFYLYVAVVLALLVLEDRLLFNTRTAHDYWDDPPPGLSPADVTLTSADGTHLHGWWTMPPEWTPDHGALLCLHGNGCNLSTLGPSAVMWRDGLNVAVLLIDYPGFGRSDGQPSEAGLYAAGDAAYDWLTKEKKVPATRILIHGLSLGGGVAIDLAARRPHQALILSSTFTSFPDEAQSVMPFVPGKWLAHNQFRNLDKIAHVTTPIFIAHSPTDPLIPFSHGVRLYDAATSEHKRLLPIVNGPHDLRDEWQIHVAVRDFLLEVEPTDKYLRKGGPFARSGLHQIQLQFFNKASLGHIDPD